MVARRVCVKCIKSKVNNTHASTASHLFLNILFANIYTTGTITTPKSVPINRQPNGTIPNISMPIPISTLPSGGWVVSYMLI